jgi:hypothetical protein
MLDFPKIKEIKLTDVLARYKIALRYKTDYAVCACPLPTHKQGDNTKSFSINLAGNYWRCFSDSCNANNGGKRGGDVINFVALMEGCREKDAAQKLADWFKVSETKTPARTTEQGRKPTNTSDYPDNNKSSDSVKYMASIDLWFDETFRPVEGESEMQFWTRLRKSVKSKLVESFRAGQKK